MYTTKIEDSFENEDFTAHFLTTGLPKFPLRTLNIVDVYFLVVITIFSLSTSEHKIKKKIKRKMTNFMNLCWNPTWGQFSLFHG
jgi:hypothetical protein